jgi:hypothetical protein
MTSLRSTFNRFTPELQIQYSNAFEVLVKFGIFTGKSPISTNKNLRSTGCCRNYATQSFIRYAIYVWNILVSNSKIPNNIRVYFRAVQDIQEYNMDDLAQQTGLPSYVSYEQWLSPPPFSLLMSEFSHSNQLFE